MTQTNITDKVTRVAIVANGKYQSRRVASKLFATFKEDKRFYLSKKDPDIVISIGGDGMLLSAFHMYEKNLDKVRFVGIHTGHLGFYTDYRDFEVEKLSTRLGLLKFEGYITITDNVQNKVYYSVTCTCVSTKRRVAIEVAGSTDNEYLIKQLSEKSSSLNEMYVDFENCIVGHYIRGDDYFPMIVQTYQAESLKIL